ncbi:MAG: hypothetical protein ACKOOF_05145 [Planctomycetaceae bacterium]
MKFRTVATALAVACLSFTSARTTHAEAIQGLFNTGVSGSGTALAENATDTHWEIVASPFEATLSGSTTITGTVPNFYNGPARADWINGWTTFTANSGSATWITAGNASLLPGQFEDQDVNGNIGLYTFRTTFTIPEAFASAQITGLWAADNIGGVASDFNQNTPSGITEYIRLNGNVISPGLPVYGFTARSFTISSGFIQGVNVLEFNVSNLIGDYAPNPVGTQIVFTSATYAVPEPQVSVLAATGLGIVGFRHFRRRRKA